LGDWGTPQQAKEEKRIFSLLRKCVYTSNACFLSKTTNNHPGQVSQSDSQRLYFTLAKGEVFPP